MERLSPPGAGGPPAESDLRGRAYVELRGICKRYDATLAVDRVDLRIEAGSVHALVGENGAGKSTLGKILAGVHRPDEGSFALEGEEVAFRSPGQALASGVTMIAQELALVPTRTVLENVYLGIEDRRGVMLDRRRMRRRFAELVASTGFALPHDAFVGELLVAQQQQVEILRAAARDARLIVMDEPTARLSAGEITALHRIVRSLAERGVTVVFISHYLEEVLALSDVVTVLRDGRVVRTGPAREETPDSLVEAMVGRTLATSFPSRDARPPDAAEVLRVDGLGSDGVFEDVSLVVEAGEIVGLAGLVGAGRSEVARAVFGIDRYDRGRVAVCGQDLTQAGARKMIDAGVAMIPEARKTQGLLLGRSVKENMTLRYLDRFSRRGVLSRRAELAATDAMSEELDIRRASDEQPVATLSGGNQQKVLFGRWLIERPRLLIADEPTSGIDIAAKRAIYQLLVSLAENGVGILLISSEMEEVLGLTDRILVMRKGRVVEELARKDATEHRLIEAAFGARDETAEEAA